MANQRIAVGSHLYEKVKTVKYVGSLLPNQNFIYEEIKCRPRNSCCYSIQTRLSSRLFYKNLKIKINKTIILAVLLYACEIWYLKIREECGIRRINTNHIIPSY
jgi:hypothetical protein